MTHGNSRRAEIEDVFQKLYTDRGLPSEDSDFSGRSDYQAFILNDISAGGLFTGVPVESGIRGISHCRPGL